MKPMGLSDHLAVLVPGQEGEVVFFGVERRGNVEYSERDRSVVGLLQGHLANARSLAQQQAEVPELNPESVLPRLRRAGMTAREAETLYWMVEGKTNEEIAVILGLRITTVKTHVGSIFIKLGVENRLAAVKCAMQVAMACEGFQTVGPRIVFDANGRRQNAGVA
jgi:DNA-binding CsgD family transcriptional regulator